MHENLQEIRNFTIEVDTYNIVDTDKMIANVVTKGLPRSKHIWCVQMMGLCAQNTNMCDVMETLDKSCS